MFRSLVVTCWHFFQLNPLFIFFFELMICVQWAKSSQTKSSNRRHLMVFSFTSWMFKTRGRAKPFLRLVIIMPFSTFYQRVFSFFLTTNFIFMTFWVFFLSIREQACSTSCYFSSIHLIWVSFYLRVLVILQNKLLLFVAMLVFVVVQWRWTK